MLIIPEIRELQAVIALVHEHGFAGAAKSLGVSQPSVSMRIAKLEQIFGFTLFHRRPEGNVLTEEGRRLLPMISNINCEYDSLLSRVSYWRRAQHKTLRILADGSLLAEVLRDLTTTGGGDVANSHQWASLGESTDWHESLLSYHADLVVAGSFLNSGNLPGIRTELIFRQRGLTVAWNPDYYDFSEKKFNFPDSVASSVIVPCETMAFGFWEFISRWCQESYGFSLLGNLIVTTEAEAVRECAEGIGVLVLPGDAESRLQLRGEGLHVAQVFDSLLPEAFTFGIRYRAEERNPLILDAVEKLASSARLRACL